MGLKIIKWLIWLALALILFNVVINNAKVHCDCDKEHIKVYEEKAVHNINTSHKVDNNR